MIHTRALSLLLMLTLGRARADVQQPAAVSAPRLQISRLSGELKIELDKSIDSVPAYKIPFLHSGSVVRVLAGSAAFDSDYHVTVRAGEGDAFRFIAIRPEAGRSGAVRVLAVGPVPAELSVSVGDHKFRLKKGGAITIAHAWPGEMTVRSEGPGVLLAPGSMAKDGSILAKPRAMAPDAAIRVAVPESPGFENAVINTSVLNVSASAGGSFAVRADRPSGRGVLSREADARRVIASWPVISQRTAEVIIEKYGPPDLALKDRLVWYDNGAWKITTVYRDPREHIDVLEQTIGYGVPQEKMEALAKLDVALRLSLDNKELSAVSESEETNILALNLADEVVRELKSPQEAREFYLKTVVQSNAGRTSRYMKSLLFR